MEGRRGYDAVRQVEAGVDALTTQISKSLLRDLEEDWAKAVADGQAVQRETQSLRAELQTTSAELSAKIQRAVLDDQRRTDETRRVCQQELADMQSQIQRQAASDLERAEAERLLRQQEANESRERIGEVSSLVKELFRSLELMMNEQAKVSEAFTVRMEQSCATLDDRANDLTSKLQAATARLARSEEKLAAVGLEVDEQARGLEGRQAADEALRGALKDLERRVEGLGRDAQRSAQDLSRTTDRLARLEAQCAADQALLRDADARLQATTSATDNAARAIAAEETRRDGLEQDLNAMTTTVETLAKAQPGLHTQVSSLAAAAQDLKARTAGLEDKERLHADAFAEARAQLDGALRVGDRTRTEVGAMQAQQAHLEGQVRAVRDAVDSASRKTAEIATAQAAQEDERHDLARRVTNADQEFARARGAQERARTELLERVAASVRTTEELLEAAEARHAEARERAGEQTEAKLVRAGEVTEASLARVQNDVREELLALRSSVHSATASAEQSRQVAEEAGRRAAEGLRATDDRVRAGLAGLQRGLEEGAAERKDQQVAAEMTARSTTQLAARARDAADACVANSSELRDRLFAIEAALEPDRWMGHFRAEVSERAYEASLRACQELLKDAERKHNHVLSAMQTLFVHNGLQPPIALSPRSRSVSSQRSAIARAVKESNARPKGR